MPVKGAWMLRADTGATSYSAEEFKFRTDFSWGKSTSQEEVKGNPHKGDSSTSKGLAGVGTELLHFSSFPFILSGTM